MKELTDGFVYATLQWLMDLANESKQRWTNALETMEAHRQDPTNSPPYTTEHIVNDVFSVWRQALRFDPFGTVGGFTYTAFIHVTEFVGGKTSHAVPALNPRDVKITSLVDGASGQLFPPKHVAVQPGSSSVAVQLTNLLELSKNPPPAGHYVGLLWEDTGVIANVHVLVTTERAPAP